MPVLIEVPGLYVADEIVVRALAGEAFEEGVRKRDVQPFTAEYLTIASEVTRRAEQIFEQSGSGTPLR